jgi:2-keto-4-pentenoate hydratase/2-oxohepta-3-ene-1,7-dioic acid hydratase in catechol pathway
MRLLRLGPPGGEVPCALAPDGTVRNLSGWVPDWSGPVLDPNALAHLAARLADDADTLPVLDPETVRVGPPVLPGHLISIGLNYRDHAAAVDMALPAEPIVASKAPSALAGPHDDLVLPPGGDKTDWEVELAVVIGRQAQYLADEQAAADVIAGYCTANDISERGWLLERNGQWLKGKSFPGFAPLGPWLVTADEVPDPQQLALTCRVNGRLMQDGNTSEMVFPVRYLVWYVSQFLLLRPGDVLLTGSPAGIALGRPDRPYLRAGDLVETEVAGLGAQRRRCRNYAGN